MYKRSLQSVLERFSKLYPVLGIIGPRQSGKTTLAKMLFPHLPYVSLENLDIRVQAQQDLRSFLDYYKNGAIFDEVQHAPELLSYLQGVVDESSQKGRYVLTGSQNFALSHHISQSLSGRIGIVTLLPLSLSELEEFDNPFTKIFKGGYPMVHSLDMHPLDFYPSYIQTYIERDIRQLKNIEDCNRFQTLLKLCAGRIGQIVNFSSLAQDCGISHTTARKWLNILEASYIVFFLQPFYKNFNKRLIKMPKLYFRYGVMSSSKTANLLMVSHNYKIQNKKILLIKPKLDDRYDISIIKSRTGMKTNADLIIYNTYDLLFPYVNFNTQLLKKCVFK